MAVKEKTVTWEITLDMPEKYNVGAVADRITKTLQHSIESDKTLWGDVVYNGACILIKEDRHGEVIR